jgi:hypothetical protein
VTRLCYLIRQPFRPNRIYYTFLLDFFKFDIDFIESIVMGGSDCLNKLFESKPAYSSVIMPGENHKTHRGHERNTSLIRVFTVVAYICSVSIAATVLSLYYFFIWDPTTNNQNSTLVTYTSNSTTSHLLAHSKSSSPLLRPLLGNCSLSTDDGMFSKSIDSQDMLISLFVSSFPSIQ